MALVESNPLFQINGRVGRYVVKKFNGKRVVYLRPLHYKKTQSKRAFNLQSRFAVVSKLAQQVNSVCQLSAVWNQSSIKGFSTYHKIIKYNLMIANEEELMSSIVIVPPSFPSPIQELSIKKNNIFITSTLTTNLVTGVGLEEITLHFVFIFHGRKRNNHREIFFANLEGSIQYAESFDSLPQHLELTREIKSMIKKYRRCCIYITMVWKFKNDNIYNWFSTYSKSIQF